MSQFDKPRILTDSEANVIRGKCLIGAATPRELMQLIGHFDLIEHKSRMAIETLSGCFPDKLYVFGAHGERWSEVPPDPHEYDDYETINFKELLGEE